MYINSYDEIPLWAWGLDLESIGNKNFERIDISYFREEIDLLTDFDFLFDDSSYYDMDEFF